MTAPLNAPSKDAASARKRRRRAPAGGAADDCFACSKRNIKCDRKRPYCSQCLTAGNDCPGYKTQLTWGVGVASRGKLRGLSLPIAKSPPVNCVKKSPTRTRTGSNATTTPWNDQDDRVGREDVDPPADHPPHIHPTPFPGYDLSHISSPDHTPSISQVAWDSMRFSGGLSTSEGHQYQPRPVHLSVPGTGEMLPPSAIEAMSDVDYMSPLAPSFPRDDISFLHSPAMYEGFQGPNSPVSQSPAPGIMIETPRVPTSCPNLVYAPSETGSSLQSHVDNYDTQFRQKLMQDCDPLVPGTPDLEIYSTSTQSHGQFWPSSIPEEDPAPQNMVKHNPTPWPSVFHAQTLSVTSDLITKMPFFMDHYENAMCPSMVLIDCSDNPFRGHIMRLARSSRCLQHAICALAACNLRMKRRLSLGQHEREFGEKRLNASIADSTSDAAQPADQSLSEEHSHRDLAVHFLNEQLKDTEKTKHDSVLATILLLCHYRMAESGIAKFHSQFAAVKRILTMRRASPFPPSRESAWMETIFTYFDAIAASVNDREAQLSPTLNGIAPDTQLLAPGAENLVGCDRELFKTISKLGRLNLLSQHRPVQNLLASTLTTGGVPSRSESPLNPPLGHTYRPTHTQHTSHLSPDPHAFPHHHNSRFESNGFASGLDDEDMFSAPPIHPPIFDDYRHAFWREWKEARSALQGWEFDSQRVIASLSPGASTASAGTPTSVSGPTPTPAQIHDLRCLSEAFRYAALLYTERLAHPDMPSSHSDIGNLVTQAVYYATSIDSGSSAEKFLLWPLFVAGSECVNELQQSMVRSKCRDIMARSGYMNNLTALNILERVWAGDLKDEAPSTEANGIMRRGLFNWAKYMGGQGEWIIF